VFFLELGDKKFDYLERQQQEYLNGLSTSMHFLKSLDTLVINENVVKKDKEAINIIEYTVQNGSDEYNEIGLTELRDRESDAKFKICFADNAISANEIKKHPNIYKYFPAVKEVNNLSFVIHSNLFELSSNRQNLTETPINKNLLRLLSKQVIDNMEVFKSKNRSTFKNLFTSILMSEESPSNSSGNGWQSDHFYKILLEYVKKAIPTKNGFSDNAQNVKINKINPKLNVDLADFGLRDIQWFEWDNELDKLLINEATKLDKLGIEEWDIRDVIENANLVGINDWIANRDENTYEAFLAELEKIYLREETKRKLFEIKLFKFSDNMFYSINDVWATENVKETYQERSYNQFKRAYETINKSRIVQKSILNQSIIFNTDKTINISKELQNLGFTVSLNNISTYKGIYSALSEKFPKEKDIYNIISEKCKTNTLTSEEKKILFLNFINETTKFNNVAEGTLKDLHLFCDSNSVIKPLNRLIDYNLNTLSWLNAFKIISEEYFTELKPYLVSEKEVIFKEIYLPKQDIILSVLTEVSEIKSLIKLYQENKRQFFKEFIIKKTEHSFAIAKKTNNTYQVQVGDQEVRTFIEEKCANNLFVLPQEFLTFKEEDGIVNKINLHSLILDFVDIDAHKETLVSTVHYDEPKRKFLKNLSEFRFSSKVTYSKEDYEYKVLELVCKELKESEYPIFRDKFVIETENQELILSEIPPFTDKIKIDDYEISLAKILPNNYENSDHLGGLINQFIELGLGKNRVEKLFGIGEEAQPVDILQMLSEQVKTLENAEQLAFLLLYNEWEEEIDLAAFDVLAKDGAEYNLTYNYYIKSFAFLPIDVILDDRYKGIKKILNELPFVITDNNQLLEEPYFENEKFVCPDLISQNLTDEQKLSFINYLFNHWDKKDKKTVVRKIDWSKIDDKETERILGFNPNKSVFPSKYACESEVLPNYMIKWIGKDDNRIDFISDLGVWTGISVIVELRKYLSDEINEFQNNRLAQEIRFNKYETNLFNSFVWLKENAIKIKSVEQFETFKKVVEIINENRTDYGDLEIIEDFDFEELKENSTEWNELFYEDWKEVSDVSIFLYEGELPKRISLDEIDDYEFYSFYSGNAVVDDENNFYINQNTDVKKEIRKLELEENNEFNFDGLWQSRMEILEKENAQLKQSNVNIYGTNFDDEDEAEFRQIYKEGYTRVKAHWRSLPNRNDINFNEYWLNKLTSDLQSYNNLTVGTNFSSDLSKNDQKEANREAKVIVKEKLESIGFEFTNGIEEFSAINGVIKEGIEYPLVVKSYKDQDEPLKIGANEWIQLMRPNSMFWVYFGNDKIACLKLNELLRNQDNLTISFSTENLDVENRLEKFAELLRYFGDVHFDFHSVKPNNYSTATVMGSYQFAERKTEEDLSSDDQELL
jgi:hypothetical protein